MNGGSKLKIIAAWAQMPSTSPLRQGSGKGPGPEKNRLVQVEFTRSAWRQFAGMNRGLGIRFIRGFVLRHEVAAYIAAHEEQGIALDTTCQEIHYDCGIYMLLMKCHGVWYITEIWMTNVPTRFVPVYLWQRVKRGWRECIARALSGWRAIMIAPGQEQQEVVL